MERTWGQTRHTKMTWRDKTPGQYGCAARDSNPEPADEESAALPVELAARSERCDRSSNRRGIANRAGPRAGAGRPRWQGPGTFGRKDSKHQYSERPAVAVSGQGSALLGCRYYHVR